MRFVPVVLAVTDAEVMLPGPASNVRADIPVELRRGNAQLAVCRPSSQSEHCAAWLIALARAVLK